MFFLKQLQKFLKIDVAYLVREGFWLGLDQAVSIGVSFVLIYVFGNFLSQEVYGTYRYVLSVFSILTISTLPNMNIALTASVARGYEGSMYSALRQRISWGMIGACAGIFIALYYFLSGDFVLGISFLITAAAIPWMDSYNIFGAFLKGKKFFKIQAQYSIIVRAVSAFSIIAAVFYSKNIYIILLSFFLPYIVLHVSFFLLTMRQYSPNKSIEKDTIRYGKHLSAIQFLGVVINYLDSILIFHFLGPASLAVYSIATAPLSKIRQAFSIILELALPKFSERSTQEVHSILLQKIWRAVLLSLVGIGIYIVTIPVVFKLFLPLYAESIFYSQLAAITLLNLPFSFIYTFFQSKGFVNIIYRYNAYIRLFQILAVVILVPMYGILGAVMVSIIFQLFSISVLVYFFNRTKYLTSEGY